MLLAIDLHKDFIDEEGVAITSMVPLQSSSVDCSEFDAPQADRFVADGDTALCEMIFDISVAQVESIAEPDGVTDDIWRESVALIPIHSPILAITGQLSWQYFRMTH